MRLVLACQFGMGAFAVPYFFVYDPALLGIDVTWVQVVVSFITAIAGGVSASIAMMGVFAYRLNIIDRLGFALAAVLFLRSDWRFDALAALLALFHPVPVPFLVTPLPVHIRLHPLHGQPVRSVCRIEQG